MQINKSIKLWYFFILTLYSPIDPDIFLLVHGEFTDFNFFLSAHAIKISVLYIKV